MATKFFPAALTRREYLIRCLIAFAVVVAALLFFVAVPTGDAVRIAGILLQVVVLLAFLYNIVGLSIPRLKIAQISIWAVLLVFIPFGALILFAICALAREKA
jgi:uncharacterized membrane protein YhaH (DUF805 family)